MAVGFHRLCCLWEAQRGDGDVYKIWNVHTGLIYGLHRSATTLKPLGENNIDYLVTMQCSVGKPGVLALMWIFWRCLQTLQIPIWSSFCDNPQDPMDLLPKSWCPTLQLSVVANPWLSHCCYNMSIQDKKQQYPLSIMFMDHSCINKANTKSFKTHSVWMDMIECDGSLGFTDLMHK